MHHAAGRLDEAAQAYEAALAAQDDADTRVALGQVRCLQRRFDEGILHFETALRMRPDDAAARNLLGAACLDAGRMEEAVRHHEAVLAAHPDDAGTHAFLGIAWGRRHDPDRAAQHFDAALRLAPDDAGALLHYGIMLYRAGRLEAARGRLEAALRRAPDDPLARYHHGLLLLRMGDLAGGWAGYEARLEIQRFTSMRRELRRKPERSSAGMSREAGDEEGVRSAVPPVSEIALPRWDGSPLNGRTLVVRAEQGFGDAMQFVRYLGALSGGRIVLECPRSLIRLLARCEGAAEVVESGSGDVEVPLMSLPLQFGTTLATVPAPIPYLHPDPEEVARWSAILAGEERLRVGVAWSGNPQDPDHGARRLPPALLPAPPGVALYSLQKGEPAGPGIADVTWALDDFAETAALVANLDLVVTVDTAVAHLAGGMGRPIWLLLSHDPDWRWMAEREDSPWYPTMRIFRQRAPGAWGEVTARVAAALAGMAREGGDAADAAAALRLAVIARRFVPAGTRVLEAGPARGLDRFVSVSPSDPTQIVAADATAVGLSDLRGRGLPVVAGYPPGFEPAAVAETVVRAGFRVAGGERLGDGWLVLRLEPVTPPG